MYASKSRVTHARSDAARAPRTQTQYTNARIPFTLILASLTLPHAARSAVRRFHSIQRPRRCLLPTSNMDLQRRSISGVRRMETQQRIRQKGDSGRAGRTGSHPKYGNSLAVLASIRHAPASATGTNVKSQSNAVVLRAECAMKYVTNYGI